MKPEDDPSNPSADYSAMIGDWQLIGDIRAGMSAVKRAGQKYLPKYEKEGQKAYELRLAATPWRPEFVDALRNLCSKPFTKEVTLQGEVPQQIKDLSEDIDGSGNSLHVFSREAFTNGVAAGLEAIYVAYPDAEPAPNLAAEKASGVRPYWVHIQADDILALYTKKINGRDVVTHIRVKECAVTRNKYAETKSERVRVIEFDQAGAVVWRLYELQKDANAQPTWTQIQNGTLTIGVIPVVLYFTGERSGTYCVKPPLIDLANMQLEIYRALSREDEILTFAGSPMLKAKGMNPPQATQTMQMVNGREQFIETPAPEITVGPKTVLFAPPGTEANSTDWDFIQPNAANIKAVSENVDAKINHFRHLALQPSTSDSGRLTATQAAIDASKAHSAIEVWANVLKDALEQAFVFTCMWLKIDATVEVSVHTDFGVDVEGFDEYANLIAMNGNGKLSDDTLWQEGQRRGILGPQFDRDKEPEKIAGDVQGMELNGTTEPLTDPVTGKPIKQVNMLPPPTAKSGKQTLNA